MDERLRPLIEKGKDTGVLHFDEVNAVLPDPVDPEELAAVLDLLERHGIALVDEDDGTDPPADAAALLKPELPDGSAGDDPHDADLLALVRGWGIAATDAIALREPGGRLFEGAILVPGMDALRTWVTLRSRVVEFPHWPVVGPAIRTDRFETFADLRSDDGEESDPGACRGRARELIAEAGRLTPEPWLFRHGPRTHPVPYPVAPAVFDPPRPRPAYPRPEDLDWVLVERFMALEHPLSQTPYPFVRIGLAPTPVPWEVFAYWPYGGWNEAPWPAEQLVMVRHWHERFGAEPVSIPGDYFEMVVWDPPTSPAAALRLADEQIWFGEETIFAYGDIPDDERVRRAVSRRVWHFWWD